MCPFGRFDVKVADPLFLLNCGVLAVRQGARAPVAEPSYVIRISAEVLCLGPNSEWCKGSLFEQICQIKEKWHQLVQVRTSCERKEVVMVE